MVGKPGNWVISVAALATAVTVAGACGGGSSSGCRYENWRGTCQFSSARRLKTIERFPRSFVVVEAIYEPQGSAAPPSVSHQVTAQSAHEGELLDFLQAHPSVECSVVDASGPACSAPQMQLALPEFVPSGTGQARSGPAGCAKIETSASAQQVATQKQIQEILKFDEHASSARADSQPLVDRVAELMRADSAIQCLAITGQISFGERLELGEARAEAVQKALIAKGIDRARLTVMRGIAPAYSGTPPQERVALPEHRKVTFAVVVYDQ